MINHDKRVSMLLEHSMESSFVMKYFVCVNCDWVIVDSMVEHKKNWIKDAPENLHSYINAFTILSFPIIWFFFYFGF